MKPYTQCTIHTHSFSDFVLRVYTNILQVVQKSFCDGIHIASFYIDLVVHNNRKREQEVENVNMKIFFTKKPRPETTAYIDLYKAKSSHQINTRKIINQFLDLRRHECSLDQMSYFNYVIILYLFPTGAEERTGTGTTLATAEVISAAPNVPEFCPAVVLLHASKSTDMSLSTWPGIEPAALGIEGQQLANQVDCLKIVIDPLSAAIVRSLKISLCKPKDLQKSTRNRVKTRGAIHRHIASPRYERAKPAPAIDRLLATLTAYAALVLCGGTVGNLLVEEVGVKYIQKLRIPTRNTILRWVASFRITGSTLKNKSPGRNSIALRLSEATLFILTAPEHELAETGVQYIYATYCDSHLETRTRFPQESRSRVSRHGLHRALGDGARLGEAREGCARNCTCGVKGGRTLPNLPEARPSGDIQIIREDTRRNFSRNYSLVIKEKTQVNLGRTFRVGVEPDDAGKLRLIRLLGRVQEERCDILIGLVPRKEPVEGSARRYRTASGLCALLAESYQSQRAVLSIVAKRNLRFSEVMSETTSSPQMAALPTPLDMMDY
ncbi:hypothetical protein ANN_25248 [Periplaneta americana]|uniref:Uncharacterized protein n=1 Tax=Periplaneta americana TaxID=6978 RepID=A0ABQ8S130_PERAM|nr:hypothetical protein ANN_25248 [Periplaneta americana]